MEINWKVLAIFGGFGFFLSLLVGAVSGVGFGTILLRGLISGVLFAGVGFGLSLLIKKYLPGLLSDAAETESGKEESAGVDIVIEEEAGDSVREDMSSAADARDTGFAEEEEEETENFIEEVEEISSESSEPDDLIEVDDETSVDALPDIGEFTDSFATDVSEEDSEEQESRMQSIDSSATIDLNGREEDPRMVAKAVQSMMKKE